MSRGRSEEGNRRVNAVEEGTSLKKIKKGVGVVDISLLFFSSLY